MRPRVTGLLAALFAVLGCFGPSERYQPDASSGAGGPGFALERVMEGLDRPVHLTHAGASDLWIVEQPGRLLVWDGEAAPRVALDLRGSVSCCGERGLLSVAFHPDHATNRLLYVSYTDTAGDSVVARYTTHAEDPRRVDASSAQVLLTVDQPYSNHNGGLVMFGPDGYLYVGLGDGGSGGDPQGHGQNRETLLGSLLRLDVNVPLGYTVPADNPFVLGPGRDEIWAYGLRNPWRFSFDRETGDLFLADVGQNRWEEVNHRPADAPGGANFGWNRYEGNHDFETGTSAPGAVMPVAEYARAEGRCSVTGGFVYRGPTVTSLSGTYLFGDYCDGTIWGLQREGGLWMMRHLLDTDLSITSFGEDEQGELYVVHHGGGIYRFVAA